MAMFGLIVGLMAGYSIRKNYERRQQIEQHQSKFINISDEDRETILEYRKQNNIIPMTYEEINNNARQIMEDRWKEHEQYLSNMSDEDKIALQKITPMTPKEIEQKANLIMEERGKKMSQQLEDFAKELRSKNKNKL
jgi:hypothetical protein